MTTYQGTFPESQDIISPKEPSTSISPEKQLDFQIKKITSKTEESTSGLITGESVGSTNPKQNVQITIENEKENVIDQLEKKYKLVTDYIKGDGIQLRLHYTKLEPVRNIVASLCIVHGLGEHSGRYVEVSLLFFLSVYLFTD